MRAPKANAVCERLGGSLRRECLDFLILFNERHLPKKFVSGPHVITAREAITALGRVCRSPWSEQVPPDQHKHGLPLGYRVLKKSVFGGLHHEYGLAKEAA